MILPPSSRTRATERRYQEDIRDGKTVGLLDEPAIVQYKYWKLIVNRYPYDEEWCTSMLLVYLKRSKWEDLPEEAVTELHRLKIGFKNVFDKIIENGWAKATVMDIPHVHLLQGQK